MPVIVVSGSGRKVGKTSLVCALIEALPEYHWTAVKISTHRHRGPEAVRQETAPGQGSDTARYLAAGAERAFLVTAADAEVAPRVEALRSGAAMPADWIFESNRVLEDLQPDLALAVLGPEDAGHKPSFARVAHRADATVRRGPHDRVIAGSGMGFELTDLTRIAPPMRQWVRTRLGCP